MGDVGYRGVSADQDGRYRNKEQLLLKKLASNGQFASNFSEKVHMEKVDLEVMKPWISDKVSELLGFEDDVVVEYIQGMLEDPDNKVPDPKKMQLSLTGFLESQTPKFMAELWTLLLSAQKSLGGIPQEFVEKKKEEMRLARERDQNAIKNSGAVHDYRARAVPDGTSSQTQRDDYAGNRGRGRRSRCDDRRPPPRGDFTDKNGNRTERVQDRGWAAKAGPRPGLDSGSARRMDPYPPSRRAFRGDDYSRRESARYQDERRPYRREADRSLSPPHRRPSGKEDRSISPDARHNGREKRSNSITRRRQPERSITPDMRGRRKAPSVSRSRSRSYSPSRHERRRSDSLSPRRYRKRSESYSPSPPRRSSRRSPSFTPPSRRRYSRKQTVSRSPSSRSVSRSRSPARRRPRLSPSRSVSRSYSPPSPR